MVNFIIGKVLHLFFRWKLKQEPLTVFQNVNDLMETNPQLLPCRHRSVAGQWPIIMSKSLIPNTIVRPDQTSKRVSHSSSSRFFFLIGEFRWHTMVNHWLMEYFPHGFSRTLYKVINHFSSATREKNWVGCQRSKATFYYVSNYHMAHFRYGYLTCHVCVQRTPQLIATRIRL